MQFLIGLAISGLFGFMIVTLILDHIETTGGVYLDKIINAALRWRGRCNDCETAVLQHERCNDHAQREQDGGIADHAHV